MYAKNKVSHLDKIATQYHSSSSLVYLKITPIFTCVSKYISKYISSVYTWPNGGTPSFGPNNQPQVILEILEG